MAACSDEGGEPPARAPQQAEAEARLADRRWLDPLDKVAPEVWLASRMAQADVTEADPDAVRIGKTLDAAAHHFHESQRMIANRAVQLEGMLAGVPASEKALDLIESLTDVVGSRAESFGAICQQYYNLRSSGLGREEALSDLKQRYGGRT